MASEHDNLLVLYFGTVFQTGLPWLVGSGWQPGPLSCEQGTQGQRGGETARQGGRLSRTGRQCGAPGHLERIGAWSSCRSCSKRTTVDEVFWSAERRLELFNTTLLSPKCSPSRGGREGRNHHIPTGIPPILLSHRTRNHTFPQEFPQYGGVLLTVEEIKEKRRRKRRRRRRRGRL